VFLTCSVASGYDEDEALARAVAASLQQEEKEKRRRQQPQQRQRQQQQQVSQYVYEILHHGSVFVSSSMLSSAYL